MDLEIDSPLGFANIKVSPIPGFLTKSYILGRMVLIPYDTPKNTTLMIVHGWLS